MVQNNKVLTVSYGTFSCTLEGFDDSFETMKAIAEYFRDLSADDRYFGSEPPQPDAEMLARIAQRDAAKHVEASQSDSGLLLRATQQAAKPAPAAVQTAAQTDTHVMSPSATPPAQGAESFFADAEPVESAPAPAADSIAAKLQRIRAVVSHSEENSVIYAEDEDTSLVNQPAAPKDAVAAAFEMGSLDSSDLTETDEPEAAVDPTAPAFEAENLEYTPTLAEPVAEAVALEEPSEAEVVTPEEPEEPIQPFSMQQDTDYEDEEEAPTPSALFTDLEETAETDEPGNILSEEAEEDQIEEVAETNDGYLTAEDEANVLSEISKVEAAMDGQSPNETALDQDLSRLMDKVDSQMDDPATSTQRETYSHLRTAVAATEAEREDQSKQEESNEIGYRGDLTSVVSPRRPEIQVTSMRPQSDTSSPLKLVAEQRVDAGEQDAGPVTPRRVTSKSEDESADSNEEGGFALFAQEQGAQSLPDLLEAAAAYLSFIEGQEQFSRPQLMNKIRSLKQDDFNREESLRSFGQLLRDGKIEKAGGGRFAASTQIGFRPDDERAAG
ncbi:hypothetical protein [Ruegeria atlantica]|uniref:Chemotaxis protein CheA n=1 Tax=Ruegeria atlantica TaxID=81569 RepID=A0A0P1E922_9RHOB|nr:hypothetical protein [Ruegeria atlantica]CUH44898.1 hypothetical protein RUM4293_03807 [Ruegeria atlantica]